MVKRNMIMTLREAEQKMYQSRENGDYQKAIILKDLYNLYAEANIWQSNERLILSNPNSPSTSLARERVQQLIEDLSYDKVPVSLRNEISALESQLDKKE